MNKEIEEAIEGIKEVEKLNYGVIAIYASKHIQTLLSLAQSYLAVKGMPEEKTSIDDGEAIGLINGVEARAHNDLLHLCKLALLKKEAEWKERFPSEEEIQAEICLAFAQSSQKGIIINLNFDYKSLAHSIRKMMEEKLTKKGGVR